MLEPMIWFVRRTRYSDSSFVHSGNGNDRTIGIHANVDPFMTLCFMALPVIPELKITDTGLFDVNGFHTVAVEQG